MGKHNVSIADPETQVVPPSQQSAQGPVPKPGELLVLKNRTPKEEPKSKLTIVTPSKHEEP